MKPLKIDKTNLNLIIDIFLLIMLMAMAGIGFLMKYVLIAGYKRNDGRGNTFDLEFLGLDRHEWGSVHLIISLTFIGLLVLHIVFHWNMILCMFLRLIPFKSFRFTVIILLIASSLILISFPLFIKPRETFHEPLYRNQRNFNRLSAPEQDRISDEVIPVIPPKDTIQRPERRQETRNQPASMARTDREHHHEEYLEYEVFGYETMQSVADKYDVPVSIIANDLNIPLKFADRRLGWLRRQYNFTMTDVRESIYNYKNK